MNSEHRKVGQYWTLLEAEALVAWWNSSANRPTVELTSAHRSYLASANLVHHGDEPRPFLLGHYLGTFLFVAELLHDVETGAVPYGSIYKNKHEQDPRWCESLAPAMIRSLGLDLPFEVVESVEGKLQVIRTSR